MNPPVTGCLCGVCWSHRFSWMLLIDHVPWLQQLPTTPESLLQHLSQPQPTWPARTCQQPLEFHEPTELSGTPPTTGVGNCMCTNSSQSLFPDPKEGTFPSTGNDCCNPSPSAPPPSQGDFRVASTATHLHPLDLLQNPCCALKGSQLQYFYTISFSPN